MRGFPFFGFLGIHHFNSKEGTMNQRMLCGSVFLLSASLAVPLFAASLTQQQQLGKIMYQDKDFSWNRTQSCQTCHHQISGFADPTNMRDPESTVVSLGDDGVSKGGRNAPSSAYAGFSPKLQKDGDVYVGGMFWDGRATGLSTDLGDPLAEQAQGPPLNEVEMNMPDLGTVVQVVRDSSYAHLFITVYDPATLADDELAWDAIAKAIAAYERSPEVQMFSSRYDSGTLKNQETLGKELFAAKCAGCHSMDKVYTDKGPLFTNYKYYNIGLPANGEDLVPAGDLGLGGFLAKDEAPEEFKADAAAEVGKFKVPTLRNVALTAPYGHNGIFATLEEMVQFKNSRDSLFDEWGVESDVKDNVYTENDFGHMGLSQNDVDNIVAFLKTLTDK
jgi:cytochrome c peroxidase